MVSSTNYEVCTSLYDFLKSCHFVPIGFKYSSNFSVKLRHCVSQILYDVLATAESTSCVALGLSHVTCQLAAH
jgi:hypothetical protein